MMSKLGFVIILGIFGSLAVKWVNPSIQPLFSLKQIVGDGADRDKESVYRVRLVSDDMTAEVHSASVIEVDEGILSAVWYGGTREGSKDTVILHSTLALHSKTANPTTVNSMLIEPVWKPSEVIVSRKATQQDLSRYVKKLGNPVITKDPQGRVWLFYVSVSVGGWAGSAINVKYSDDQGHSWSPSKRLVTSPFINISTLVKSKPFFYDDGTLGLPVYHEFIGKFPEIVHLDKNGEVLGKQRLWWGRASLQPEVIPVGPQEAVVFLRSASIELNRILRMVTGSTVKRGSTPQALALLNPNAGISAWRKDDGAMLMVFNNSPDQRNILSLAHSKDNGQHWTVIHDFENVSKPPLNRFSYPTLIQSTDGHYHMLYTWNRTQIKHVEFNDVWLEAMLQ